MRGMLTNLLKQVASRVIVYYCLIALLVIACIKVEKAKLARVNNLQDIAFYPVQYLHGQEAFDERKFRIAKKYYQAFIHAVPFYATPGVVDGPVALSRTYAMLAVCDNYLGKTEEAVEFFKKAIALEPKHFWLNYDLGLMYFKRGEYADAVRYLQKSFVLKVGVVDESMRLDYVEYWPRHFAYQYHDLSLLAFRQVVEKSYQLSILAYEQMKDPQMAKNLAALAIQSGFGDKGGFFEYFAGLSRQRPVVAMDNFRLMVNPSVNFVPIGKEKFMVGNYIKAAEGKP